MDKKQNFDDKANRELTRKPASGLRDLEGGQKTRELAYYKEAKLFLRPDRATLTFFAKDGVASIHFDRDRSEVFYKGHNVKNMTLTAQEWDYLQHFGEYLKEKGANPRLREAYEFCLQQALSRHG